jgi:GT2 family glycosyltransferase
MTPRATIVVHLEGSREEASGCLGALAALDPAPEHETIVVDDATVGLEDLLDDLPGDVRVLRNERREGLVTCAIRAAEQAGGEILVLLRGAPELEPPALAALAAALADPAMAASAASLPLRPDAHPACTYALALRREDAGCLPRVVGAAPGCELAAICVELASSGRGVATVPGAVARPSRPRTPSARAPLGDLPELTVVIPTLDAASERVRECVATVQARTDSPHQIVLIDNGAPPQGFAAPVNAGLRAVDTPYAVVMNDDVELLSGWWPPLRDALDAGAPAAFPLTEGTWVRTDFAAWCFALTRATLDEMAHAPGEFFDPQFRVWYQDTDLLTRLRAAGRPPQLVRESRVRHGLSTTVESDDPELRAWIEDTVREDRAAFQRKHPSVPVHAD